jgi:hypothetical protein
MANVPYKQIKRIWNATVKNVAIPGIRKLSEARKKKLRTRWDEWGELAHEESKLAIDIFIEIVEAMRDNDRYHGQSWSNFYFVIRNGHNWLNVLEQAAVKPAKEGAKWYDED